MPLPRDISGKAVKTGLQDTGYYAAGDYVVPEYNEAGNKTAKGQIVGQSSDVVDMAQKMVAHALMGGGEPLVISTTDLNAPINVRKSKKKTREGEEVKTPKMTHKGVGPVDKSPKMAQPTELPMPNLKVDGLDLAVSVAPHTNTILQPYPPIPTSSSIEIVFSTQLGRIKVNALAVLESNDALILVFANEGEIHYEPSPGTNVQLIINTKVQNTMYPGFKFLWIDNKICLMVFVKLEE